LIENYIEEEFFGKTIKDY